jgi:type IV pilus assembly protein PilM
MARGLISRLTSDPPPRHIFELSEAGIAVARLNGAEPELGFQPLPGQTISVSPVRDNVLSMEDLSAAVATLAPRNEKRARAVLILPDFSVRVSVLDFDSFPPDVEQQRSLVRFRIKKSLPFDVESATVTYHPQQNGKKWDVVVAVAPVEILARYEAPFRAAGFHPGLVTISSLCAMEMVKGAGVCVLAKLSGRALTLAVVANGILKLHRSLELAGTGPEETVSHLFPTIAYIEDQLQARPKNILLCGFGDQTQDVWSEIEREVQVQVEPVRSRFGSPNEFNAGLMGYLESAEES